MVANTSVQNRFLLLFPTCQVRVSRFYQSYLLLPPPPPNSELQISVGTAGPQQRAPDLSAHCRTSTAVPHRELKTLDWPWTRRHVASAGGELSRLWRAWSRCQEAVECPGPERMSCIMPEQNVRIMPESQNRMSE